MIQKVPKERVSFFATFSLSRHPFFAPVFRPFACNKLLPSSRSTSLRSASARSFNRRSDCTDENQQCFELFLFLYFSPLSSNRADRMFPARSFPGVMALVGLATFPFHLLDFFHPLSYAFSSIFPHIRCRPRRAILRFRLPMTLCVAQSPIIT